MNLFFNHQIRTNQSLVQILFGKQTRGMSVRQNVVAGKRDTVTIQPRERLVEVVGINVKVQKSTKEKEVIKAYAKLERDLKSCMRCRFFYGNNSQCIANRCVKEDLKPQEILNDKCLGCTYPQSEGYCFPCMKEILGHTKKENQKDMEEDKDG